jgi:hypothetical protein
MGMTFRLGREGVAIAVGATDDDVVAAVEEQLDRLLDLLGLLGDVLHIGDVLVEGLLHDDAGAVLRAGPAAVADGAEVDEGDLGRPVELDLRLRLRGETETAEQAEDRSEQGQAFHGKAPQGVGRVTASCR